MPRKKRSAKSIKSVLLKKSREAIITAVQIYNNPLITFKSETFITLCIIAWTYLHHAYYREKKINYIHRESTGRKLYKKTKYGAHMYWSLGTCLEHDQCPLDPATKQNLHFLIGVRNEIEHQMTLNIDQSISAKLQACCINYNTYIKKLFGEKYGVDSQLAMSIQFSPITPEQYSLLSTPELPGNLQNYIGDFEKDLDEIILNNAQYAYRVIFVQKLVKKEGLADSVIEFVDPSSPLADHVNKQYAVIKEMEKKKFRAKYIVTLMRTNGHTKFNMHHHTELWKQLDAKKEGKGYGTEVVKGEWYWYDSWIKIVQNHCDENKDRYQ